MLKGQGVHKILCATVNNRKMSEVSVSCTSPELKNILNHAVFNLIPEKSKRQSNMYENSDL
jgi:hypothetical protein